MLECDGAAEWLLRQRRDAGRDTSAVSAIESGELVAGALVPVPHALRKDPRPLRGGFPTHHM